VAPVHFITQMRYAKCDRKRPWVVHLVLMLSYLTMLVLIMFFLESMASGPGVDWRVHVFGLLATIGLLATTIWAIRGRLLKSETQYQHSHESDWMFLTLLIVVASTGILQFGLHRSGLDAAANVAYVVHLMAVVRCSPWRCRSASGPTSLPAAGDVLRRRARRRRDGQSPREGRRAHRRGPDRMTGGMDMDGQKIGVYVCNCGTNIARSWTATRWSKRRRRSPASPWRDRTSTCAPTPGRR